MRTLRKLAKKAILSYSPLSLLRTSEQPTKSPGIPDDFLFGVALRTSSESPNPRRSPRARGRTKRRGEARRAGTGICHLGQKSVIPACMKAAFDELPGVSVSKMRATGAITAEMETTTIAFGEVGFVVGLLLHRFPNGGSWSLFRCPGCGRRARILRLLEGRPVCCRCCKARGHHARVELLDYRKRAAYLSPKRIERLNSDIPARLHPRKGRMLDKRANMELRLKRSLIVERRGKIEQFEKDVGKR
jgi:hypothetical protein